MMSLSVPFLALFMALSCVIIGARFTDIRGDDDNSNQQRAPGANRGGNGYGNDDGEYLLRGGASNTFEYDREVFMWATGGDGLRSMTASMGFINLFEQVLNDRRRKLGRFSTNEGNPQKLWMSDFYSISANSEAAWFALQFFYSSNFRSKTIGVPPESLHSFVLDWMKEYLAINSNLPKADTCQLFEAFSNSYQQGRTLRQECDLIFAKYGGDWAYFVQSVFEATSNAYNDPGFETRLADENGRGWLLDQVNLFIQSTLSPTSRNRELDQIFNISPNARGGSSNNRQVMAVGIPMQYSVKNTYTTYYMAALDQSVPIQNSNGYAPSFFEQDTFSNYYQYGDYGTLLTYPTSNTFDTASFADPFGGTATVSQAAAISSASMGVMSGVAPSILSQFSSAATYSDDFQDTQFWYNDVAADAYDTPIFDDLAVCSQWPNPCGNSDGRFVSGSFSDGFSLAQTIGQYHQDGNNPSSSILKIILTNNGYYTWNDVDFRQYFETDFNSGISPGDFLWAPSDDWESTIPSAGIPSRSPQIFEEYLSTSNIWSSMNPIFGTNYTWGEFKGTTLQNAGFGVKSGQKVKILYIRINSGIPTDILGRKKTNDNMEPLADLAVDIARNNDLRTIISNFLEKETPGSSYCSFSPDYGCYRYGYPECCVMWPYQCPNAQPPCDISGGSYCNYVEDYNCYFSGYPECCLSNPSRCPIEQPPCDFTPNSYCNWNPEYQCYIGGYPECCSTNPANCPQQQPPCNNNDGASYCQDYNDYDCYFYGIPSCCYDSAPTCPRDKPGCEYFD